MNGISAASMTALALQNHELLQTLATATNGRHSEGEGHMTLRTKVVEEDDDPVSKIVAAKTAAILNGSKSPEITDEAGVSRKPRKGTPIKLCHTPPVKGIPADVSEASLVGPCETDANEENSSDITQNTNCGKDAGNLNIGTMKIPIHNPSKESPRAIMKSASPSISPKSNPNNKEDIIEAVADSNAEETLANVETLRLHDKQYEIVPLGNKQWITRHEYEIMKELCAVQQPSIFSREKNIATLKVPVFKINRSSNDKEQFLSNEHSPKRTIDEVDKDDNNDDESTSKKQKQDTQESELTTPEQSESQDYWDAMVIDNAQDESKEAQGEEQGTDDDEQVTDTNEGFEEGREVNKKNNKDLPSENVKESCDEK